MDNEEVVPPPSPPLSPLGHERKETSPRVGTVCHAVRLEPCECSLPDCQCRLSLSLAQVTLDYSWEQLHCGHWKDVKSCWRQAYALASLSKALNLYLLGKGKEALVELDKGILLGAPVLRNSLHVVAALVNRELTGEAGEGDPMVGSLAEDINDTAQVSATDSLAYQTAKCVHTLSK